MNIFGYGFLISEVWVMILYLRLWVSWRRSRCRMRRTPFEIPLSVSFEAFYDSMELHVFCGFKIPLRLYRDCQVDPALYIVVGDQHRFSIFRSIWAYLSHLLPQIYDVGGHGFYFSYLYHLIGRGWNFPGIIYDGAEFFDGLQNIYGNGGTPHPV